jgi:hypothetical protein
VAEATSALVDLKLILRPPQNSGGGYKDPKLDLLLQSHLEKMQMFFWNYTDPANKTRGWQAASLKTAQAFQKTAWLVKRLRKWGHAYILDRDNLPLNIYGTWNSSILEDCKGNLTDLRRELHLNLAKENKGW